VKEFVHLHLHTQYSLLDGANKIPDILEKAHALGQPAIAMTDHGNMHGAIEFYLEAKRIGIQAMIGCEMYVTPGSRLDRRPKNQGGGGTNHLTLLSTSLEGYRNLCKLITLAYREGFYFKPRVDHELLREYNAGIVALTGCLAGELNSFVSVDDIRRARSLIEDYAQIFKDRLYLEVQPHTAPDQHKLNAGCRELAKDLGLPLVATNDCHYPEEGDHHAQEVLMCVSTGKRITDPDRLQHEGFQLSLKTYDQMLEGFGGEAWAEEALRNAVSIARSSTLKFDFNTYYMPQFPAEKEKTLSDMMAERARDGLRRRFETMEQKSGPLAQSETQRYQDRLESELKLIDKMGFSGYFLVVSDFIVWAKEHGIPVGPGRGSVAGSLVAFAMRITDVDPIVNKLLFERFLNPERVSMPDIDVDFCIYGRDRVIQYVVEKYGRDRVAQICTFGTLKAKAALKDVGRALGISYAETDRVAQLVPTPRQGFDYPLVEAIKMEPKLRAYAENEGKELVSLAMKLEGLTRHTSTHAAGVVIGDRPLIELVPLMLDKDQQEVTQYSMTYVEKIGLVKFDFLGLKTLTVIHTALRIILESRQAPLNLELLPLDDPKTFSLLCSGNTTGVFQLESGGITDMTVRLKPNCFDDLVAILALYRPGPLDAGMVDHYIERKHGREPVTYLHPLMQRHLEDTYGIMLYQEQIMQLARELAGYSLGEADLLRKAMGKKNPEEMAKQRDRFLSGASKKQIDQKLANEIFDQMETFARYGFNRSHSAAYALVSYQTAYLKAHYPVEFMAALMSHEMEDSDKTLKNLTECRKHAVEVLPPDVNESSAGFSVRGGKIRFGLEAVKGIGEKAVAAIIQARDSGGRFADIEDLLERVDLQALNRRVLESLVKCGAFDFSGVTRRELMERLDDVMRAAQSLHKDIASNQMSLFGGAQGKSSIPRRTTNRPEWPVNTRLAFEREALGFYISGHPLEKFRPELKRLGVQTAVHVKAHASERGEARIAGVVTALKLKNTKKGDRYATFVLEDWTGTIEAIVWPDTYRQFAQILGASEPVLIGGKLNVSEERCVLIVERMDSLIAIRDRSATQGVLLLKEHDQWEEHTEILLKVLQKYPGNCPVKIRLKMSGAEISIVLKDRKDSPVGVVPSEALCEEVEQIFGRPVLAFV